MRRQRPASRPLALGRRIVVTASCAVLTAACSRSGSIGPCSTPGGPELGSPEASIIDGGCRRFDAPPSDTLITVPADAPVSKGAEHYIAPSGSDGNAGTLASPWLTWRYAQTKLSPGDTLYARGGTYTGQYGTWNASGTASAPITFAAYPGESPVFDGSDGASTSYGDFMIVDGAHYVVIDGLGMQNQNVTANIWVGNDGAGNSDHITIRNCRFANWGSRIYNDHAIYVSLGTSYITVNNNVMLGHGIGAGVHLYHYPAGTVYHVFNNIVANAYWGVLLDDGHDDATIEGNTFYGCVRSVQVAYYESVPTLNAVVRNNVSYTTGRYQAFFVDPANVGNVQADYNDWYDSSVSTPIQWGSTSYSVAQLQGMGMFQHSLQVDPRLRDPAGDDFRLTSGSPAIDKGLDVSTYDFDLDYVVRPLGPAYDLGAFEYH